MMNHVSMYKDGRVLKIYMSYTRQKYLHVELFSRKNIIHVVNLCLVIPGRCKINFWVSFVSVVGSGVGGRGLDEPPGLPGPFHIWSRGDSGTRVVRSNGNRACTLHGRVRFGSDVSRPGGTSFHRLSLHR